MSVLETATAALAAKPITNPAIKLLVDKLVSIQASQKSGQSTIDSYKHSLAEAGKQQEARGLEIAAFTKALKKLGHKG